MKSDRIRRLLAKGLSAAEIAERLKVKASYVHTIKWLDKKANVKKKAQVERSHDPKVKKAEKKYLKKVEALYKKPTPRLIKEAQEMKQALDVIEKKPTLKMRSWVEAQEKPTKLFVQPQYKDAALKLLGMKEADPVNHPPHYKSGGIETIDFIEAKDLNYRLGNVVKYVSRAGKKGDPIQDLEKAAWYLQREIATRKNA
jgi:transcriptional regulator with XRE-family HTH domain